MIAEIQNVVPRNDKEVTVFYRVMSDRKVIEENKAFKNSASFNTIRNYVESRREAIENIPEPDFEPLIGEIIEEVI